MRRWTRGTVMTKVDTDVEYEITDDEWYHRQEDIKCHDLGIDTLPTWEKEISLFKN